MVFIGTFACLFVRLSVRLRVGLAPFVKIMYGSVA